MNVRRLLALAALALALAAPLLVTPYTVTLLNYVGVYALVAVGLTLLTGVSGVVSFGQAAFVGVAAYATAWATTAGGLSPWLGLLFALALVGLASLAIGAMSMRLKGHLLSLSTLAWGLAIFFAFGNVDGLGQYTGISDIPPLHLGPWSLATSARIYYLILACVAAALWLTTQLLDSRVGRAMRALRGGGQLVESVGADVFAARLTAFVLAAMLAGLSGWLYAHLGRYVSPTPFDAGMGIEYLMMAMIGGAASPIGGLIGAAIVALMKNAIQDYLPLLTHGPAGQAEIVVFSALFILLLQRAPEGLTPHLAALLPRPPPHAPPAGVAPLARRQRPRPGAPLLKLDGVVKRFQGLTAVSDLSFEIRAGEIVGLIGPNGAGKSTTFNLITGVDAPNAGAIAFNGAPVAGRRQYRIARLGVARTFQHVKLRPRMSALDNVLIGAHGRLQAGVLAGALRLNRAEEASARAEALALIDRVGLKGRAYNLAGHLSLGEQRLLEIARALIADPILLVLDEPAAGLRRPEKLALAELMRSLRAEGLTLLVVEHDMDFVMNLVDRLVVMDFGCKLCEGPPGEVRDDPRVREAYLGGLA
jgi:branched-chain amino acid transport system permease protein